MSDALLLVAAFLTIFCGMAWLALAMPVHWCQARGSAPPPRSTSRGLRALGVLALVVGGSLCVRADHPTMAALVWAMMVTASALAVAFVLAWRPRWLSCLVMTRASGAARP
jgi:hypothetical protein